MGSIARALRDARNALRPPPALLERAADAGAHPQRAVRTLNRILSRLEFEVKTLQVASSNRANPDAVLREGAARRRN
jgi:hypothetical protein